MTDPVGAQTLEIMSSAVNYNRRLFSLVRPWLTGRVLDVGAGTGTFIKRLLAEKFKVAALDINPEYLRGLTTAFPGLPNYRLDLQTKGLPASLAKSFDSIIMLNVLEHIEDDSRALENLFKILKSKGRLVIVVPAHSWAYGELDKELGHFRRYSLQILEKKLTAAGFKILALHHISPVSIFGWWFNGQILGKRVIPDKQVRLLDFLIPALSVLEDLLKLPFGLSLFCVAQKP